MTTELILEVVRENVEQRRLDSPEFEVGQRVLWKAELNNPGNYAPDDMLSGTVITKFWNHIGYTYRIELDQNWQRTSDSQLGQKIVVGNLYNTRIHLLP